jgi:hypothetical protein
MNDYSVTETVALHLFGIKPKKNRCLEAGRDSSFSRVEFIVVGK